MKNIIFSIRPASLIILSAALFFASCSTPKYYEFRKMSLTSASEIDSLFIEKLESKNLVEEAKHSIAASELNGSTVDTALFKHLMAEGVISKPSSRALKKEFKQEIKNIIKGESPWNSLVSSKNSTLIAPSDVAQNKEDTKPMNKAAVAGFIASLLALIGLAVPFFWIFVIPAIILGFVALHKIKETGERGYGFALASVIVGFAMIFILLLAVIFIASLFAAAS